MFPFKFDKSLRQEAFDLYVGGMNCREIGKIYKCSHEAVRGWIREIDGSVLRGRGSIVSAESKVIRETIVRLRAEGAPVRDIAVVVDRHQAWVYKILRGEDKYCKPRADDPLPPPPPKVEPPERFLLPPSSIRPLTKDELMAGKAYGSMRPAEVFV